MIQAIPSFEFGQNYFIVPVNNYQNTVHTNTTHELDTFGFYFPLLISAMHTDHHKVEYSYRKKSATEESFFLYLYSTL
jgi:hypothetical protein